MNVKSKTKKTQWGRWKFERTMGTLVLHDGNDWYEVDVDAIDKAGAGAAAEALDWIVQVAHKTWMTSADVANLVYALDDVLDLQGSVIHRG